MISKKIKAKVCTNRECELVITKEWTAAFHLGCCPVCNSDTIEVKEKINEDGD